MIQNQRITPAIVWQEWEWESGGGHCSGYTERDGAMQQLGRRNKEKVLDYVEASAAGYHMKRGEQSRNQGWFLDLGLST